MAAFPQPPIFGVVHNTTANGQEDKVARPGLISIVDIFDDFLFSTSDKNLEINPPADQNNSFSKEDDYDYDSNDDHDSDEDKPRKRIRGNNKSMTEEQKVERRERNREHAKRSRVRKKFLLESLQSSVKALEEENEKLRDVIKEHLKDEASMILASCSNGGPTVIATNPREATKTLDNPDYSLVKALQTAQQNFVISDPSLPDNPIVYASQGFLTLTGYSLNEVLGRNCRFLQGPETDIKMVEKIRMGIDKGEDTTVVLLNYRKDGSTFWNQLFIAGLRDADGNVVNYLGVQCKVSEEYAFTYLKSSSAVPQPLGLSLGMGLGSDPLDLLKK